MVANQEVLARVQVGELAKPELRRIQEAKGHGWLILSRADVVLPFTEAAPLHLHRFSSQELPEIVIPHAMRPLLDLDMDAVIDQGSRHGQAGLNTIQQTVGEDMHLHAVMVNEGPHSYHAIEPFDVGRLVIKGREPLKGDDLEEVLDSGDIYELPEDKQIDYEEGKIWLPVQKRFRYADGHKDLQIPEFPRAHSRGKLHPYLGIEEIGVDQDDDSGVLTRLASTGKVGFSKDVCLWVAEGRLDFSLNGVKESVRVPHVASNGLKPDDVPWRIMAETIGERVSHVGVQVYHALSI